MIALLIYSISSGFSTVNNKVLINVKYRKLSYLNTSVEIIFQKYKIIIEILF